MAVENVEINVESIEKMKVENPDKNPDNIPDNRRGIRERRNRFEKKSNNSDSYGEWKRKRVSSQIKRKAEQVDSMEGKDLVMAEQPKRLRNISIPPAPRGVALTENLIDLTCSSAEGGEQVQRNRMFGGGSDDSSDNEAISSEQRAWMGVIIQLLQGYSFCPGIYKVFIRHISGIY